MLKNKNILIISNEPWGDTWYSKHNYAWELSKHNTVFFVNPPDRFKILNVLKKNITETKINDTLITIIYKNILPVKFEFLRKINEHFIFRKLSRYFNNRKLKNILFWSFDPIRLTQPKKLNPELIILHMVDKYLFQTKAEFIIAKNADIILCVAEEIAENFRKLNANVHIIPHAIPNDEFLELKTKKNKAISGIYVGNIDKRNDFEFLKVLIKTFPDVTFEFIGALVEDQLIYNGLFSGKYKNVIYHGVKPYKELKYYIQKSDFCFNIKMLEHLGNNISSHKMLQYFAQGKPIFSTIMSRYKDIKDLLYMENDVKKMIGLIQHFILNDEDATIINKRIEYAKKHSFENILSQIETLIDEK